VHKVKVIGQGHHAFHIGSQAWQICMKCNVWPCLATNISVPEQAIPGLFAVFDRSLAVLQGEFHRCSSLRFKITGARSWRQTPCGLSVSDTQNLLSPNWSTLHTVLRFFDVSWHNKASDWAWFVVLKFFVPKWPSDTVIPRCLTWRNVNILQYKLRNG